MHRSDPLILKCLEIIVVACLFQVIISGARVLQTACFSFQTRPSCDSQEACLTTISFYVSLD